VTCTPVAVKCVVNARGVGGFEAVAGGAHVIVSRSRPRAAEMVDCAAVGGW